MMKSLLLVLQLFQLPVTSAYAVQIKDNVVISVTYTTEKAVEVCTYKHALDDEEWTQPLERNCFKPTSAVGDFSTWQNERIDMVNFKVVVRYQNGKSDVIYLTTRINT